MTTTIDNVSRSPPGATPDTWQNSAPLPHRVLLGETRSVDGRHDYDTVGVQPTCVQFSDGRIDDGSVYEPPQVYVSDHRRNRQDLWIGCVGAWPVYGSSWWASCSALSWWMALSMASGSVRSMPLSVRAAATCLAGPQAVSLSKASSKTGR